MIHEKGGVEMKSFLIKRKSTFDVDNAVNVIAGVMFAGILLIVLLLVVAILFGLAIFSDNGVNTTPIKENIVSMVTNFFALMPTVGTILAVVILIAAIVLLVLYVVRMKNSGTGTSGTFQG